jgi:hypothetical protein
MQHESTSVKFGFFGIGAAGLGTVSIFMPGGPAGILTAFIAIIAGLIGSRRKERLSLAGVGIAGIVLIFLNFQAIGIIPSPVKNGDLMRHYSTAIRSSARIYEAIKKETTVPSLQEKKKARLEILDAIGQSLTAARKLEAARFDPFIPGFSKHFQGEFVRGLECLKSGYTNVDSEEKVKGAALLDQWGKWSRQNQEKLTKLWHLWHPRPSFFRTILRD